MVATRPISPKLPLVPSEPSRQFSRNWSDYVTTRPSPLRQSFSAYDFEEDDALDCEDMKLVPVIHESDDGQQFESFDHQQRGDCEDDDSFEAQCLRMSYRPTVAKFEPKGISRVEEFRGLLDPEDRNRWWNEHMAVPVFEDDSDENV
ncbi:hypothetical protein QFC19_000615 [Naganishia cerealis]|uniref:Uncharacterized protein n=1 Tax=Naganishia cerealis TaxID=610337 RepID=A0ACC2WMC0_9TREE|nr:hypothetical protein QFC19_000615 [Naganishia cerealis]